MKYLSVLFFMMVMTGCTPEGEKIINGSLNEKRLSYDIDVEVRGSVKAKELNVKAMTIQGSATLGSSVQSVIDGRLVVQGTLAASNIEVKGPADITGSAEISGGRFHKDVILRDEGTLEKVTIDGDLIVRSKKVTIKNSTTILGAIIFENEPGTVFIKGTSIHLRKGIKNGKWDKGGGADGNGPIDF